MSKEEIVTLQELKYALDNIGAFDFGDFQVETIRSILDLYNKQKEKNKKLEEDNVHLLVTGARQVAQIDLNYISKDKIREKMKQIERGFPKETMFSKEFLILDLQELLEE